MQLLLAALLNLWQRRRWTVLVAGGVVLLGIVLGAVRLTRAAGTKLPTAEAKLGEFVDYIQLRGEVKALRSIYVTAPSSAGDVQILKLVKNGSLVKKGDLVVQFDPTTQQRTLEQRTTELRQAEAEIERIKAQLRMTEEQTLTDLTKARYDVDRAKLDLSKAEILSQIDGEKSKYALADAQQKQREIEQKLASDRAGAAADIESRKQKRDKSLYDVRQAQQAIASMTRTAPADGMVTLMPNYRARMFGGGGSPPEFKEGDRAWPGATIAELPDLSTIRVTGRVDESDRGRLNADQVATVRIDALPDKELKGRVASISPLAKPDFSSWPIVKNFDLAVQLDEADTRIRPGMSATARIAVDRVPNAILVPLEAVFNKNGRSLVYVFARGKFEERGIEVGRRGNGQIIAMRGLKAGERVALQDPTLKAEGEEK
jgi:RND family efflux transporter MFP subunit